MVQKTRSRSRSRTYKKNKTYKNKNKNRATKGGFQYGKKHNLRTQTQGEILISRTPKKKTRRIYK
jgi:hypothetical protein